MEKGKYNYTPHLVWDEETDKGIPIYIIADAINPLARPGIKAGNYILDDFEEFLRQEYIIEKAKKKHLNS